MRADQQNFLYTLIDPDFYERIEQYSPSDEFLAVVSSHVDGSWTIRPGGFWSYCTPDDVDMVSQGWKIHISSTEENSEDTLDRILPILIEHRVPFKFCSDKWMLRLSTGKNWPRTAAGKFVAVYPSDEGGFVQVIDQIHKATLDLRGPYILSDRPYKDSRVVFYRYGEHMGSDRINAAGLRVPTLQAPDGSLFPDDRKPYFSLPPWVQDPFAEADTPPPAEVVLKGRYRVTGALRYSSNGGIYTAVDTLTGLNVIIREARPMLTSHGHGLDAQSFLEKEARILQKLGSSGLTPQFVDLFREWEHLFLVQEKLDAQILWMSAIRWTRALSPTVLPPAAEIFEQVRDTFRKLVHGTQAFHEKGIILRDITRTNILVTEDRELKFIDFEFAFELDRDDPPVAAWTPGYASPQQVANRRPTPEDDHYAVGALLLDVLTFNTTALTLNPEGVLATLDLVLEDTGLPRILRDTVIGLTDPDPVRRWGLDRVLLEFDAVEGLPTTRSVAFDASAPPPCGPPDAAFRHEITFTIEGITRYLQCRTDHSRKDRLWPASPEVFHTNPSGLQFGAAGIAAYLTRVTGVVGEPVLDWIREAVRTHPTPPSLYNGLAGVSLLFLELGRTDEARELFDSSNVPALVFEDPGLYYGAAGWGLANLRFWRRTGEIDYLDHAREVSRHLLRMAKTDPRGLFWDHEGKVKFGLGHGQSGIAAFFLYLHAVQPDGDLLDAAEKALDYELSYVERADNRLLWREWRGITSGPLLPHMRVGTAGFGSTALRFFALTGEPRFRRVADECAHTVSTRYANKLWQDFGLSGFGEFLLDMYRFLGDENYLNNAFHVATGILPSAIGRPEGIAFPGVEQMRISCDFGMGSAGIGMFLHRLLNPHLPHLLFPDELIFSRIESGRSTGMEPSGAEMAAG